MAQKHRIFDPPQIRPHPKSLALGPLGDTTQGVETKLRPNWSRKGDIGLLVFYLDQTRDSREPAGLDLEPAGLDLEPVGLELKPVGLELEPAGLEFGPKLA